MKEIKFLLTMLWGAGLTASWFISAMTKVIILDVFAGFGSALTIIAGLCYLSLHWDE